MEVRRYIGVPTRQLPAWSLPCKGNVLRLLHSYRDMRSFRWGKVHYPFVGTTNMVGCTEPGGYVVFLTLRTGG